MTPTAVKLAAIDLTDRNGVPTCPSTVIAEECGVTHHAVVQLIDKHLSADDSDFGPLAFEMRKGSALEHGGFAKPTRIAYLTEEQATFLITLFRNTPVVVAFKIALTKAFFTLRDRRSNTAYVSLFLQEVPAAWEGTFPDSFFRAVCACYGLSYVKGKTPGFFGGFINRYIYEPLLDDLSPELKSKREEFCESSKSSENSYKLHQFLQDHCKRSLERHISNIETLLAISRTELDFKEHFSARFEGQQQLVLEFHTTADRKKNLTRQKQAS